MFSTARQSFPSPEVTRPPPPPRQNHAPLLLTALLACVLEHGTVTTRWSSALIARQSDLPVPFAVSSWPLQVRRGDRQAAVRLPLGRTDAEAIARRSSGQRRGGRLAHGRRSQSRSLTGCSNFCTV
jgi:hypothetical protein